jgi:CO/xanthine dehydrogenase Mo-binding subunit
VRELASTSVVGAPVVRVEGADKLTGRARYASDVSLPGTLWCRILRSPLAHARIVHINTERARQMPGVHAVLTGQDVRDRYVGKAMRDMPLLCWDRVRFIGDRVAAVAAETRDAADAALEAIEVEYEELPAVFDPLRPWRPTRSCYTTTSPGTPARRLIASPATSTTAAPA